MEIYPHKVLWVKLIESRQNNIKADVNEHCVAIVLDLKSADPVPFAMIPTSGSGAPHDPLVFVVGNGRQKGEYA